MAQPCQIPAVVSTRSLRPTQSVGLALRGSNPMRNLYVKKSNAREKLGLDFAELTVSALDS